MMLTTALSQMLNLVSLALLVVAAYLLTLTLAALVARPSPPPAGPGRRRFAVLVPAHNEEGLIARILDNLVALDYPRDCVDIHVVADNCTDGTAAVARTHGAIVHERTDQRLRGKGHALQWLLRQIETEVRSYDAFVVLDADSVVDGQFLRSMDARLQAGSQVLQAYYSVLNVGESPLATLRYAALAAVHYLRPLGRSVFGLSCGLKGNGMCFAAAIVQRFDWRWFTLAEDVEFHLALVGQGVRVDFAPEAHVLADMPVTLGQAASQNERWERGRLELLKHHAPGLIRDGLRLRSALRLDAVAEQLVPPLSVPFALGGLTLIASLIVGSPIGAALAGASLLGQLIYLLTALALVRAPASAYLALSYAPVYIGWKAWLYSRALVSTRSMAWVRTARHRAA